MSSQLTVSIKTMLPFHPCKGSWDNFLKTFNNPDPDRSFTIPELLDAGIPVPDVIWALRALPESALLAVKKFAFDCTESALPTFEVRFSDDKGPRATIETVRAYLKGEAPLEEILKARCAAAIASENAADVAADFADASSTKAVVNAIANAATATDIAAAYAAAYAAADIAAVYVAAHATAAEAEAERNKQAEFLRNRFS